MDSVQCDEQNGQRQSGEKEEQKDEKQEKISNDNATQDEGSLGNKVDDECNVEPSDSSNDDKSNADDGKTKLVDEKSDETVECDNNDKDNNDLDKNDEDEDGDPIPSGTGTVSKDCSASDLIGWSEILLKWHSKLNHRPKGLNALVKNGIPEPLRGEVWQLLSGAQQWSNLMEQYRIFLTKSAPTEQIILRDVHRTYPAHENFRSNAGSSSLLDSLFKVCKAYAVYDEEVGYCQGLSFLVAALLLHMPEEQAFCVFVRIMQHYGLRNLFRNNFDELYLKFYQLEHLLEEHMPDLHQHFAKIGIEPFTYASQWFLTVFTAKFPLNAVYYIMDVFLLDGMDTIFQVALALLLSSKQELLALDFEGVLKYFRVQMPKRYRNQENVQQLINASSEISLKKLKKHAKNYGLIKQKEKLMENPVVLLQRENTKLTENNLRLEQENDDLARDLVASKIQLRAQLDLLEDKAETLNRALTYSRQDCQTYMTTISDMEDEKSRLEVEVSQLKEVCRRELHRAETESARDSNIIADYKKICSQLSKRLEAQLNIVSDFVESLQDELRDNESCKDRSCHTIFATKSQDLIETLKSDKSHDRGKASESESTSPSKNSDSSRRISSEADPNDRPVGAYIKSANDSQSSSEIKIEQLTKHIEKLEIELARTKLALVEAECKCQQLTHDLSTGIAVKTTNLNQNYSSLTSRLDFVKAAVGNRRPTPKSASTTFAKINNLISEKISNISQQPTGSTSLTSNYNSPKRMPASDFSQSTSFDESVYQTYNSKSDTSTTTTDTTINQNRC